MKGSGKHKNATSSAASIQRGYQPEQDKLAPHLSLIKKGKLFSLEVDKLSEALPMGLNGFHAAASLAQEILEQIEINRAQSNSRDSLGSVRSKFNSEKVLESVRANAAAFLATYQAAKSQVSPQATQASVDALYATADAMVFSLTEYERRKMKSLHRSVQEAA